MGSSIEWGSATHCTTYVLGHTEEAGDHQSVSDDSNNPEEIGLMFSAGGDGYCLTGTPAQIIETLTQAITAVATYRPEEDQIAAKLEAVEALASSWDREGAPDMHADLIRAAIAGAAK